MIIPCRILLITLLVLITNGCAQYEASPTKETLHTLKAHVLAADSPTPENGGAMVESPEVGTGEDLDLMEEDDDFGDDLEEEFEKVEEEAGADPLEGYNRFMTDINDTIYVYILDPVTNGYRTVVPKVARRGVGNFFHNLLYPVRFASNLLQAKFENSGRETARFVINSTVGILGVFDPARDWFGLERSDEDFGQALGYWGVSAGPHVVLPILGPSNVRDILGMMPEGETDVVSQIEPLGTALATRGYRLINSFSLENFSYSDVKKGNLDLYLFMKNSYEQSRNKKIRE